MSGRIWRSRLYRVDDQRGFHQEYLRVHICQYHQFDFDVRDDRSLMNENSRAGTLDPWYSGCVNQSRIDPKSSNTRGLYVFTLEGSAHHLDLRTPNTCDPPNVISERYQVKRFGCVDKENLRLRTSSNVGPIRTTQAAPTSHSSKLRCRRSKKSPETVRTSSTVIHGGSIEFFPNK